MTFYILEPSVYEFWHPMVSQNQCIYAPSLEARVDEIREELRKKRQWLWMPRMRTGQAGV